MQHKLATWAESDPTRRFDRLLRLIADQAWLAEAARIVARATVAGSLTPDDRHYLGEVVAAHTGLTVSDAEYRVDTAITDAKAAADKTRKAASATAIFTALAMVIGAFIASVSAALGGRLRDEHP